VSVTRSQYRDDALNYSERIYSLASVLDTLAGAVRDLEDVQAERHAALLSQVMVGMSNEIMEHAAAVDDHLKKAYPNNGGHPVVD
jgi:hypothetical protein